MESFEQKIKERNNLLKSQVESLTGRNELTEVIDTLLKAGVAEEDLVEKAKYIRREADGKGGYKYIYSEPKEDLEKAGEGSRGGKVIGHTRSGKPIYADSNHPEHKGFDAKDHFDSKITHQKRALAVGDKYGDKSVEAGRGNTSKINIARMKKESPEDFKDFRHHVRESEKHDTKYRKKLEGKDYVERGEHAKKIEEGSSHTHNPAWHGLKSFMYSSHFSDKKHLGNSGRLHNEEKTEKSSESDLEKAKANKKQQKKIKKVMDEWKAGTLKTSSGEPVKDQKQAIAIAMSEAGMSVKKSTLSTVLKQNESDIEKGKSFPIGTIHNGFKKIAEGKWRKVSEYGMTRIEHESKSINSRRKKDLAMHAEAATKLDSKDYSDEEVVGSDKNSERKVLEQKRKDNRKSYENKEIDYDTYSKNERKLDRKFEKVLKKSEDNDIEKSHLGEFSYSEKLGIKKTGKEIKEKFKANLQKEQSEASELKAKLGVLKTKIGEEPTKKCDYWQIDAYEDKGIDIPLVYDYSQMKGEEKMSPIAETLVVETESQPKENITSLMYQYNEVVRKYIDCQKEILQINTILNNYKDTDIYQLTISQATVLGF